MKPRIEGIARVSDPTVTLRLTADNSKLVPAVRASREEVAGLGKASVATGQQATKGAQGVRQIGDASEHVTRKASAMAGVLNQARAAMGAYLGIQGVAKLSGAADAYSDITGKLKQTTNGEAELAAARKVTFDISQQYFQQLDATVTLYGRSARAMAEYGYQQSVVAEMTKTVSAGLLVDRATTAEAASAMLQLSQALGAGALRGEEFNAVNEAAPSLMTALARSLNVGRGELKKLAEDGKLTIDVLVEAFTGAQAKAIQQQASEVPLTIARAWQQTKNEMLVYVGSADQVNGVSSTAAQGIALLGKNLDLLATAALAAAIAYGGRLVGSLAEGAASKVQSALQARVLAQAELQAARAAEVHAVARLNMARAGMAAAGGLATAEAGLAAAQARTAAAVQASSIALTAKAAATRAASVAMAAFGGPVGLAITALTLFVMWAKNSKAETDRLAESVSAGFQGAIDKLQDFNKETANKEFAGLASANKSLEEAQKLVSTLTREYADLNQSRDYWLTKGGALPAGMQESLDAAAQKLEVARVKVDQLSDAQRSAIDVTRDFVLEKAGIVDMTDRQRESLEALLVSQSNEGQTIQQNIPHLVRWATEQVSVEAANRLAKASFDDVAAAANAAGIAIKDAVAEVSQGLNQQINQLQLKMIEQTQGKAAAMRAGFIKSLADKGIDPTSAEAQALRVLNEQLIAGTEQSERFAKSTQAVSQAQADAKRRGEENARLLEQQADSQRRYTDEAALAAAELSGPLKVAEEQRKQRIAELDAELVKHNITQAAYNTLAEAARETERKRQVEVAAEHRAPQALLDTMSGEVQMLGLIGPARERYLRQLRNEEDMRRTINEANKAGAGINAEMTASLVDQARAYADLSIAVEEQATNLQELADVGTRGVADLSDLFADTLSNNLDDSKSFFDQLKDVFKRGWRDLLRTMMEQNFVRPFQNILSNAINGAFSGANTGGGWFSQLGSLFGGGRGMTGTGAMAAQSTWGAALAAGAGSSLGFGNNIGALAGIVGASASVSGSGGIGDMVQIAGMLYKAVPASGISGGMIAGASYAGGALGALYGWNKGGDTVGKGLGAAAYGAAGYYGATAVGTVAAGYAAAGTAGAAAAGSAALASIPVAGWVALAAIVVDKVSGGKLFGTKYQTKETGQTINIGEDGGSVSAYAYQEGQKSLFRGKKRRTIDIDASEESKETASELYKLIQQTGKAASDALGLASVDIISGSFKAVYDKKGNLTSELATVLGKTYAEGFEQFQQRLAAENIVAQISQLDDTASVIAERWRSSAEKLQDGAQFLLAAAVDFNDGAGLLNEGGLSRLTDLIEKLRTTDETMTQAYQRVMSGARAYGDTAASAYQEVATTGFSNFAKSLLQVKQEEKERIRTLQAQAKALGGLSAREEDLAKVREAAQLKTDALVTGLQSELVDLALNRLNDQIEQLGGSADGAGSKIQDFINGLRMSDTLSPDTDATRRVTANDLMSAAALAGDADAFTQYAQQFLEVSRALNASGAGYQADYDRVLDMAKQFGGEGNAASLEQLYAQREALQAQQEAAARLERAQRIAQGVSDLSGVNGRDPLEILRSVTGMTPDQLAGDLGLSVGELGQYLAAQKTDIGDLADILYDLPKRIAAEMITVLVDREVPVTGSPTPGNAGTGSNASSGSKTTVGENRLIEELGRLNTVLARQQVLQEMDLLRQER